MKTNEETGEIETVVNSTTTEFDLETGESSPESNGINFDACCFKKTNSFHVPRSCLLASSKTGTKKKPKSCISKNRIYYVANKKAVINLKQVSNKCGPHTKKNSLIQGNSQSHNP